MSPRALDVLAFVHFFAEINRRPPTIRQVAAGLVRRPRGGRRDAVGYPHSAVARWISELQDCGLVIRRPGHRALTLTPSGRARLRT